jgi:hypothetical protein
VTAHRRPDAIDEATGPAVLALAFGLLAVALRGPVELLLARFLVLVGR